MLSTVDLLSVVEEQKVCEIEQLAKKLDMPVEQLEELVKTLSKHNLLEYSPKNRRVKLPLWLLNIEKQVEESRPATGAIILPRYQEIAVQDITVGNFTRNDLELKIRFGARLKEIAICDPS
jgi:DNA-binding IclR family transcriptional regulator